MEPETVVHAPPVEDSAVTACCGVLVTQIPENEEITLWPQLATCTRNRVCCGGDPNRTCYGEGCPTPCPRTVDGQHVLVADDPLPEGHPMRGRVEPGQRCEACAKPFPKPAEA